MQPAVQAGRGRANALAAISVASCAVRRVLREKPSEVVKRGFLPSLTQIHLGMSVLPRSWVVCCTVAERNLDALSDALRSEAEDCVVFSLFFGTQKLPLWLLSDALREARLFSVEIQCLNLGGRYRNADLRDQLVVSRRCIDPTRENCAAGCAAGCAATLHAYEFSRSWLVACVCFCTSAHEARKAREHVSSRARELESSRARELESSRAREPSCLCVERAQTSTRQNWLVARTIPASAKK
jgi:hypothetical protein